MVKPSILILLASPRGFCAGVDRAIQIVERALTMYGAPVYVRHEIVHNRTVVQDLESKGAVFVDELDRVPKGATVVFSAHGVAKSVPEEADRRRLRHVDATCPLVTKVHREAEQHHKAGRAVILIGHAGHPEVVGTLGQLPDGAIHLVETLEDAERVNIDPDRDVAFVTQTTLAVDDTADVVAALGNRIPNLVAPRKEDICYATTNRQNAVKSIAPRCDAMVVIGAPNSSNSVRLTEVAIQSGCPRSTLIQGPEDMDWELFRDAATVGITAGASAPEILVEEILGAFRERFEVSVEEVAVTTEDVQFKLPAMLDA
jgi:4-hydroxy-3-methylbut-2-enyl diphosphate reductase